jgi:hypothetical protein
MLQLKPNCECCNADLPPESLDARICSFECTFCLDCAMHVLHGMCPNCGGELLIRPPRLSGSSKREDVSRRYDRRSHVLPCDNSVRGKPEAA